VKGKDGTFDTVFQTRTQNTLIMRVHLPLTSANAVPRMTLIGAQLSHAWIDGNSRVTGYDNIYSEAVWAASQSTLGDAVNEVVRHLQLDPPMVLAITDVNLQNMQPKQTQQHQPMHPHPPAYGQVQEKEEKEEELPFDFVVPDSFPTLDTLSKADMAHLLNSTIDLEEYAQNLPTKVSALEFQQSFTDGNAEIAKATLEHEAELQELEQEVRKLAADCTGKLAAYKELEALKTKLTQPADMKDVRRKLRIAKKQAMEESDELAMTWGDGDNDRMSVDDFVAEFLDQRIVFHERSAKLELLTHS